MFVFDHCTISQHRNPLSVKRISFFFSVLSFILVLVRNVLSKTIKVTLENQETTLLKHTVKFDGKKIEKISLLVTIYPIFIGV